MLDDDEIRAVFIVIQDVAFKLQPGEWSRLMPACPLCGFLYHVITCPLHPHWMLMSSVISTGTVLSCLLVICSLGWRWRSSLSPRSITVPGRESSRPTRGSSRVAWRRSCSRG